MRKEEKVNVKGIDEINWNLELQAFKKWWPN